MGGQYLVSPITEYRKKCQCWYWRWCRISHWAHSTNL